MKLDIRQNDYATDGGVSHGRFRVSNNSAMQKILSDALYSDKISAVIRELSCNALEAHKDASCESTPFEVTLPTAYDYRFAIRDFGPGLSRENLEELYTTYGASTRRNSNDYIGSFGLGSKSPFALADAFTVISRHNGKKFIVSNTKDSRGNYCYDLLSESDTTERSGLEIIINLDKNNCNIHDYKNKAEAIYKWFEKPPVTNITLNLKKDIVKESGDGWEIVSYEKHSYYSNRSTNVCLMGPVAYIIDERQFKGIAHQVLSCCVLNIKVGIGDVSIAPSREALQYDQHTIDKITGILENLYSSIQAKLNKEVGACKSLWEARVLAKKYLKNNPFTNKILNGNIEYGGKQVSLNMRFSRSIYPTRYRWDDYDKRVTETKKHVTIDIEENVKFAIYEDGGFAAAKRYVEKNPTTILYVILDDYKQILIDEAGVLESEILKTSNFPACVRKARTKSAGNTIQAYSYNAVSTTYYNWKFSPSRSWWRDKTVDLDTESGYYCPLLTFNIIHPTHNYINLKPGDLQENYTGKANIIGILASREDKVKNHKNWKHIREWFKEQLDLLAKNPNIQKYYSTTDYDVYTKELLKLKPHLSLNTTPLYKHLKLIEDVNIHKTSIDKFKALKSCYDVISDKKYDDIKANPINLTFNVGTYPLLKLIPTNYWKDWSVIQYINNVDSGNIK